MLYSHYRPTVYPLNLFCILDIMVAHRVLLTTCGVQKQIEDIYASSKTSKIVGHGLIIGQRSSSSACSAHAIYLARTPMPEGIDPSDDVAISKVGGNHIDVEWMNEHAKQVSIVCNLSQ